MTAPVLLDAEQVSGIVWRGPGNLTPHRGSKPALSDPSLSIYRPLYPLESARHPFYKMLTRSRELSGRVREISPTHLGSNSALSNPSLSIYRPLYPLDSARHPFYKMLRSRELSGGVREISPPTEVRTQHCPTLACRYTEQALAVLRGGWNGRKFAEPVKEKNIFGQEFKERNQATDPQPSVWGGALSMHVLLKSRGRLRVCSDGAISWNLWCVTCGVLSCTGELRGQMLNCARQKRECEQHEFEVEQREPVLLSYFIYHSY